MTVWIALGAGNGRVVKLRDLALPGGNAPVRLSGHRPRGWTRDVSEFSVPVQAVQPVQPRLKWEKKTLLLLPNVLIEFLLPPQTVDEDFASPGRTGRSGWTASTMAGITRVQLRGPEAGRRRFQAGRHADLACISNPIKPGLSIRGPILFLVFLLGVCCRFPLNVGGVETGVSPTCPRVPSVIDRLAGFLPPIPNLGRTDAMQTADDSRQGARTEMNVRGCYP